MQKAAADSLDWESAFEWVNEREAERVSDDPRNQGLTANFIRDTAREWIMNGNKIKCVRETREGYRDKRHFHYDITIDLAGFPRGLYVYMELSCSDPELPTVYLLNAHPPGN